MMKKLPENKVLQSFPEEERDEVSRIWKLAKKRKQPDELNASELNAEWQRLQLRLQGEESSGSDHAESGIKHIQTGSNYEASAAANQTDGTNQASGSNQKAGNSNQASGNKTVPLKSQSLYAKRHSKFGRSFRMRRLYPGVAAVAAVLIAAFAGWFFYVPVTIEAPRGAFVSYGWSDGTRVELNSGSRLTYNRSLRNGHRAVNLHGEAYFDVPNSDRPFVVETHNARVHVLGTRFNVRSWDRNANAETILTLVEGEVTFSSYMNPENTVLLQPGQWSRVDLSAETPYEPEEVDTSRALAWRDQGFYFSSATLTDVASELERRFNRQIDLQNESLADRNLTLYLPSQQDLETIITSICHLTGCQYDWSNDQVVLY